jgi:hypothetical protein
MVKLYFSLLSFLSPSFSSASICEYEKVRLNGLPLTDYRLREPPSLKKMPNYNFNLTIFKLKMVLHICYLISVFIY